MSKPKRKATIASILKQNLEDYERLLTEMTAGLEMDRVFLFPKVPRSLTFKLTIHSHWASDGERSVYIEETKPLHQVLALGVAKFKEVNKRSDVQGYWHLSVILPSGRVVNIPDEQWKHLKEYPLAKKVFHHDDSPCEERLIKNGRRNYCPACKLHPDTQSLQTKWYCPTCDTPLKDMKCPECHLEYAMPK